ncbi:MAG: DUF1573 domain-containing protein [Isosphaeraceae bacterium]
MKRWILLTVLIVGLSAAGTVAVQFMPEPGMPGALGEAPISGGTGSSAPSGARPKAVLVGDPTFEFGRAPQFRTDSHSWTVKNEGDADLELTMLSSTCSCTLAKFKDGKTAVVKPGESTEITLEYETRDNNGDYRKGAEIGTNDPNLKQFSLYVSGLVYPAVMTYPPDPVLNYGAITNDDEEHPYGLAVFSPDRPETKILKVETSNPSVSATFEPMTTEEAAAIPTMKITAGQKLIVKVRSDLPLGAFREEVVVSTDHPKQPTFRLSLAGKMVGPINPQPGAVLMHDVGSKNGGTGGVTLVVRNQRDTTFEVVKKPEGLDVEVSPADNGAKKGRYSLRVKVPPGTAPQRFEDEIVLKTDHPKAGQVIVPLSVWVLSRAE